MSSKIGCLIIDINGTTLTAEEGELLAHPLVGGVILFTRNYESRNQLQTLCQHIRLASKKPLLIMVDQEGGRVQRFIAEFTRLPQMASLGQLYEHNVTHACHVANACGWLMAAELLTTNIDLSLAPVLDLNKGISRVIGERAFHAESTIVIELAKAFITGMQQAGMAATGKHFPGHGSVALDSHVAAPQDERSFAMLEKEDMLPFANLIKTGITAIMAAHILFPQIDSFPVGFSRYWLQDILRSRLKFSGPILTDDLNMEGANISSNYTDRVSAAREAGCDFTLLCNNRRAVTHVLDDLPYVNHLVGRDKWQVLQGRFTAPQTALQQSKRWHEARELLATMPQR